MPTTRSPVTLHYRVHATHDLIERLVELTNTGDAPVTLERMWSAQWHLPGRRVPSVASHRPLV